MQIYSFLRDCKVGMGDFELAWQIDNLASIVPFQLVARGKKPKHASAILPVCTEPGTCLAHQTKLLEYCKFRRNVYRNYRTSRCLSRSINYILTGTIYTSRSRLGFGKQSGRVSGGQGDCATHCSICYLWIKRYQ